MQFSIFFFTNITIAQDIKNVDVKTVPKSDIQKAQKAMQDAGLSTQDAANIAQIAQSERTFIIQLFVPNKPASRPKS